MIEPEEADRRARASINLASEALGAEALLASDEFFGAKERLLSDAAPVFTPGRYDDNGKWMDGWESKRRRGPGHDWCIVRLAVPGILNLVDIDTAHFTGNYPYAASLDGAHCEDAPTNATLWTEVLPAVKLSGNSSHVFEVADTAAFTHVRLNIFPDGGVARLRIYGRPATLPPPSDDGLIDIGSALSGTRVIACNDQHYGSPANLLLPGIGRSMEHGWETRRRREPGNDWALFALGHAGEIRRVEIDTAEFKGNYPDEVSLQAAYLPGLEDAAAVPMSLYWKHLLTPRNLGPNRMHVFEKELAPAGLVTHIRLNIFPDGGLNRLRLFGHVTPQQ